MVGIMLEPSYRQNIEFGVSRIFSVTSRVTQCKPLLFLDPSMILYLFLLYFCEYGIFQFLREYLTDILSI